MVAAAGAPTIAVSFDQTDEDVTGERTVLLQGRVRTAPGEGAGETAVPSDQLDEYQLLEKMGSGGMGTVYKAFHVRLHKVVALKVLHKTGGAALRRFDREMTLQARLSHPNICPVTDSGVAENGRHYLVMDFIDGVPFSQLIEERGLSLPALARILAKVARAIHYAHERGVMHRDVKPDNVLVDELGEPHVVDFGIAREVSSDKPLTAAGVAVGTPYYMAPEQIRAESGQMGPRTDVYSLGAVLFHAVAGRPPFYGATHLDTLRRALTDPVPPLRLSDGGSAPLDLEALCHRAMARDPSDRYESAAAMADDLEAFADNEPISLRPIGRFRLAVWYLRRHRRVFKYGGAAFALLVFTTSLLVSLRLAMDAQIAHELVDAGEPALAGRLLTMGRLFLAVSFAVSVLTAAIVLLFIRRALREPARRPRP